MNDFDVVTGPAPSMLPGKTKPLEAAREAPPKGKAEVPPAEALQDMSMTMSVNIPPSAPVGRRGSA
jgi:hypothetical protein